LLKEYYVVFAEPGTKSGDKPLPHLDEKEHKRIFQRAYCPPAQVGGIGAIVRGRTVDETGKRIGGLIILRANSFDEARKIVDSDPTDQRGGVWDHTIHRCRVSEGSYTVRVKYSSQSAIVS
jgi:uncharacterized protein YciI